MGTAARMSATNVIDARVLASDRGEAGAAGLALGATVVLGMFLLESALSATAKTALYVYATEDTTPPEFSNVDFSGSAK